MFEIIVEDLIYRNSFTLSFIIFHTEYTTLVIQNQVQYVGCMNLIFTGKSVLFIKLPQNLPTKNHLSLIFQ